MLYSWICELASHNNEIGNKFIHTLYIFINVGRAESVIRRTDPIPFQKSLNSKLRETLH